MTEDWITEDAKLRCVERELKLRKSVYPRWVSAGRISQEQAKREIALMQAIVDDYHKIVVGARLI